MRRLILIPAAVLFALVLPAPPAWADWVWPLHGKVITPYRYGDDPYAGGQHRGIDIAGEVGAPVVAATAGEVRFAGVAGSSGITVSIRSADGRYDTSYLHLSSVAVGKGERVATGQRVGYVGTTGARSAVEPHLHFGVRDAGTDHGYHDPLAFLPPPSSPQAPREAPGPAPAPEPARPSPAPVDAPAPAHEPVTRRAPARRRVPEERRAPARRRVPAGGRAPATQPSPVARHAPAAHGVPAARHAPAAHRAPAAHQALGPRRSPARIPSVAPRTSPRAEPSPDPRRPAAEPSASKDAAQPAERHGGPDLGLVLACVGLLVAAAILGLSEDGRRATRSGRDRLSGLMRAVTRDRRPGEGHAPDIFRS
jgi:Peptidase family M23